MLYWECKRRLALLRRFRVLALDYFDNIKPAHWSSGGAPPSMNDKAQKARHDMNKMMGDAVLSFDLLGIPHIIFYQPSRMASGYAQNLDVIVNTFELYSFQIPPQRFFDCADMAIGAYERECQKLLRKSINPLYWLGLLIVWVLHLPFRLLGAAGFDAQKAENSLLGKLAKLALGVATFAAAVIEVAERWDLVTRFVRACIVTLHRI
jgi:hypothetical protein